MLPSPLPAHDEMLSARQTPKRDYRAKGAWSFSQ